MEVFLHNFTLIIIHMISNPRSKTWAAEQSLATSMHWRQRFTYGSRN